MKMWSYLGCKPVLAHTKSEARSMFIRQLQEMEKLSFRPKRITRLRAGWKVKEIVASKEAQT